MSTPDQPHTLRVVTFPQHTPEPPEPCSGGYTCSCTLCNAERDELVRRGVRARTPLPRAA